MNEFWTNDPVVAPSKADGNFWDKDPVAKAPAFDKDDPRFSEGAMAATKAFEGVPFVGALPQKAGAAISALAHPLTGVGADGDTVVDRYAKNLEQNKAASEQFEKDHPVESAVSKMVGGTLALAPLAGTGVGATALGLTGETLAGRAGMGALSGAAIGGGDAAVRGEDPTSSAILGGFTGGVAPAIAKGVGKVASAVMDKIHPSPITPRALDVNGVQVPVRESVVTGVPDTSAEEQVILRGGRGPQAQEVATSLEDQSKAGMDQAHANFAAGLDPTGNNPRLAPEDAGHAVASELTSQEQQRAAAEAQRLQGTANDQAGLKPLMDRAPVAPGEETPHAMGEAVSAGVRGRAQAAAAARTAAYDRAAQVEGQFSPAVFNRAGNAIRDRLNGGADPVRITDRLTPNAADALGVIDEDLGHLRFEDQTRRGELTMGPDGRPQDRTITGQDVEATRKKLVALQRNANSAARAPGGSYEDARAMRRLIDEYDAHVQRGINAGGFSGNGQEYLARLAQARQLHSQYRQNFSSQGAGDKVGQAIEGIIGKHAGQEATPDAVVKTILGSASEPGGGQTVQIAQRLRGLLGENSPEWASIRKAMVSHLTEAPAGTDAIPHDVQSDRIMNFLNGTKGRTLSQVLFSPSERASLGTYATRLRNVTDPQPANQVDRIIAHISGRDGLPSSSTEVVNRLLDTKGNSAVAVQLSRQLRQQLSPQSWNAVRQGMWSKLTEPPEGMIAWGPQKISQNIHNFLKSDIAEEMFSERERGLMKTFATAHKQMIPVAGTTNPSGTAPMLAKIASGARHTLLPLLGFSHGGVPGAAIGMAADKALSWVGNKRAADNARKLFYGEGAKRQISQQLIRQITAGVRGATQSTSNSSH